MDARASHLDQPFVKKSIFRLFEILFQVLKTQDHSKSAMTEDIGHSKGFVLFNHINSFEFMVSH